MSEQPSQMHTNDDIKKDDHSPQPQKINDEYLDRFLTELKKVLEAKM